MSATTAPRSSRPLSQSPGNFLDRVTTQGPGLPSRVVLHGVEGVGKTSFAAAAPSPVFGMARGETGLETLIDSGQLGETPHFPEWQTWQEVLGSIRSLVAEPHEFKTLVIDTLNGVERLCHEFVCQRDYNGVWGKQGFTSYMQGYEVALGDWREFLGLLDELRAKRRMGIVCLTHTKVSTFKNPEGADFDRYQPDMHAKTWSLTHKWADMVLFANYHTVVVEDGARHKGRGGQDRIIYTTRHAAYDAKNRAGLPEEIDMGTSGREAWGNFMQAVKAAKGATK